MAWEFIYETSNNSVLMIKQDGILEFVHLPIIALLGLLTNGLNVFIFLNKTMKDLSFKILLVSSITDCIYLILASTYFLKFCTTCQIKTSLYMQFYLIIVDDYMTSCLAFYCTLLDVLLSIQRYSVLSSNQSFTKKINYKRVMFILFFISLLFYVPVLFLNNIKITKYNDGNISYSIDESNDLPFSAKTANLILTTVRIFLALVILSIINIINVMNFSKRFKNKVFIDFNRKSFNINTIVIKPKQSIISVHNSKLKDMNANKNITLMVICGSFLNLVGIVPYFCFQICLQIENNCLFLDQFSYGFLMVSHGSNIFIYILFNKLFRKILFKYLKKICFCSFKIGSSK